MIGELCALGAALTWSVSVLLFKKSEAISPHGMNLFKNVITVGLLLLTMAVFGIEFDLERSRWDWILLALSGLLGIAMADTLFFMALRQLGPARLAVVDCLYAPTVVLLGVGLLHESLTVALLIGGALVIVGVGLTAVEGAARYGAVPADLVARRLGVAHGVFGIVALGVGVVIVKSILESSNLIEVTTIRLVAGIAGQLLWILFVPADREALQVFRRADVMRTLLPASILGTYVSMLLWLGGFKWTSVSDASILNQLSTVFTIVLARIFLGETLDPLRAFGVALALAGAIAVLAS